MVWFIIRCEHDYCNECHSTIDDHESHAVQPCVGIPVTMNGCWYLVNKFTVGKRGIILGETQGSSSLLLLNY